MPTPSESEELGKILRQKWFSDEQFKDEFQRGIEGLLPEIGDSDVIPKLLLIHIVDFEPTTFGVDFNFLVMDDFNDAERRQHYVRMLGEQAAIDRKNAVMVIMATEAWTSTNMYRDDGSKRYEAPADDPESEEAIVVFAMSLDRRNSCARCVVTRTPDGNFQSFGELEMGYSFEPESALSSFQPLLLGHFWHGFISETAARFGK